MTCLVRGVRNILHNRAKSCPEMLQAHTVFARHKVSLASKDEKRRCRVFHLASISDTDDPVALQRLQAVTNRGHVRRIVPEPAFNWTLLGASARTGGGSDDGAIGGHIRKD